MSTQPEQTAAAAATSASSSVTPAAAPYDATQKQKSQAKTPRIPIKVVAAERLKQPDWIRVKAAPAGSRFYDIKRIVREQFRLQRADLPVVDLVIRLIARPKRGEIAALAGDFCELTRKLRRPPPKGKAA